MCHKLDGNQTAMVFKTRLFQIVLNSSKALEKDQFYKFFKNTVGEGLFSAPGQCEKM